MSKSYVRSQMLEAKEPPRSDVGLVGWIKKRLFSSVPDSILTIVGISFALYIIYGFLEFALFNASFTATNGAECRPVEGAVGGACWSYVQAYFRLFIYGRFPVEELWRVNIVFVLGAALLIPLLIPSIKQKGLFAILFFGVFPIVTLVLLSGGQFSVAGFFVPVLNMFPDSFMNFVFELVIVFAIIIAAYSALMRSVGEKPRKTAIITISAIGIFIIFLGAILRVDFGMTTVTTDVWGGFLVTLIVAITGIVISLPFGIILALGRQSKMPFIRFISVGFIEFWRGVPLITILFMAQTMIPLFLAEGGENIDKLLRALIGVALFASAYMAEVVRGGLQALPKGQYEGAMSMGLSYWPMMYLIILPQALKLVIPGIVNTFIGLFKDTTLVSIVGLFDLLGMVQNSLSDANWAFPLQASTGYLFVAAVFFIFCFGMSRYSMYTERRLHTGHKR